MAAITSVHGRAVNERHNERQQHVLYGFNVLNNTSLMPSVDSQPSFDTTMSSTNVTVSDGDSAFLVCTVRDLGDYVVSWLRYSDLNLLSVGKLKYTQDPRYQIFHVEPNDTWTLKVRGANASKIKKTERRINEA